MTSSIWLIDADGTSIHLAGAGSAWTGSGTPWTSQGTSPFELSMNEVTGGVWTPTAATPEAIFSGGPPFSSVVGVLHQGYGPVTEQVGIQARASNHDNAVALLRVLRRALTTTVARRPCILAVQPSGATGAVYYEILTASLQESPLFINQEAVSGAAGARVARAVITWTRSPHGGRYNSTGGAGLESLLSGQSWQNRGTGTPDDIISMGSSGAGDLVSQGQPVNLVITSTASLPEVWLSQLHVATVDSRVYSTTGAGAVTTSPVTILSGADISAVQRSRAQPRLLIVGQTSAANIRFTVNYYLNSTPSLFSVPSLTRIIPMPTLETGRSLLLDLGPLLTRLPQSSALDAATLGVSISVNTGTWTHTSALLLLAYTFATINAGQREWTSGDALYLHQAMSAQGRPALPATAALIYDSAAAGSPQYITEQIAGRPPIYLPGASLWMGMTGNASNQTGYRYSSAITATVAATHAPLYAALRGGG